MLRVHDHKNQLSKAKTAPAIGFRKSIKGTVRPDERGVECDMNR
jgi:hypothetical protein